MVFFALAEDEGFEPPQTESESGVLPLHKSSMQRKVTGDFVTGRQPYGHSHLRSELSTATRRMVETTGLEPVTSCV